MRSTTYRSEHGAEHRRVNQERRRGRGRSAEERRRQVTGHSHDENDVPDDAAVAPEPEPIIVATDAVSEPLEFERVDTDGTKKTLSFEPAVDTHGGDHSGTTK